MLTSWNCSRVSRTLVIQDIELAPKNAAGLVEYVTDIVLIRPADAAFLIKQAADEGIRLEP